MRQFFTIIMVFAFGQMLWAQDTMYVHQSGGVVTKYALHQVDSIIFYSEPALTDIDGNVYRTVTIGSQVWMAENLKTTHYNDGAEIEYPGSDNAAWTANTSGAYAWYSNEIFYKNLYGAIYNWHAVNSGKLCPTGWRVPSDLDWSLLTDYIIDINEDATVNNIGNFIRSCRQVDSPLGGACATLLHPRWNAFTQYGTDDYEFSGLPGGHRDYTGLYYELGVKAHWWTSSGHNEQNAWLRRIHGHMESVERTWTRKDMGFSVRCIKN